MLADLLATRAVPAESMCTGALNFRVAREKGYCLCHLSSLPVTQKSNALIV